MNILVLGSGRMGLGAAFDLAQQPDVDRVTVTDLDGARARDLSRRIASTRLAAQDLDVSDRDAVIQLMRGHAAAISCVPYRYNLQLAEAAVLAGVSLCDLGGNNAVVGAELALDAQARAAGVTIVPDCGLAPGMVAVLVAHGAKRFEQLDEIHIRVGGLPQDPRPPLDYQLVFSVEGLINEYVERARVIRGGRIMEVDSMTEIESLEFPPPFGAMEAFQTSGGTSTLPETFLGKVKELDYKTIRFPGHCVKFKSMIDLGLCRSEPLEVDGAAVVPRHLFGEVLVRHLPADGPDVVLVRVELAGRESGRTRRLRYDIIDRFDPASGLSAMMRTTAFPASIVVLMMARGQIERRGALPQERCVPTALFMQELAKRNINVTESWEDR
jgi:lysine 6-dehydrogenase